MAATALVSLGIPIFAPRTVYAYGPFTILLVCAGVQSTWSCRLWQVRAFCALLFLNATGLLHERPPTFDYAGLAREVGLRAKSGDLWFVYRHWTLTPVFYYLPEENHRLIGGDYAHVLKENSDAAVWVLGIAGRDLPPVALQSLVNYRCVERIKGRAVYADLYLPGKKVPSHLEKVSSTYGQESAQ